MTQPRDTIDLVERLAERIDLTSTMPLPRPAEGVASSEAAAATAQQPPNQPPGAVEEPSVVAPDSLPILKLDCARLEKKGILTPGGQRSLLAEEYRIIKRPLLRGAFNPDAVQNKRSNVAMVTSPRPGDGKTFTAINLGISIASERDLQVLVIDADIRRSGLSKLVGATDQKGLMDVLTDPKVSIPEVIFQTDIPNLSIIPAGRPIEASTEILASQNMVRLVNEITGQYRNRFIIFDAPPVLASSAPGVLAAHVGHIIMVILANETSKRAVAESVALVDACPNISFILNKITLSAGRDRFGYYENYQDGPPG